MGASCLIKASLASLAILAAFFNLQAASAPLSTGQTEATSNTLSPLRKCLESLEARVSEDNQRHNDLGKTDSTSKSESQTSFSEECESILGDFIASASSTPRQKVEYLPFTLLSSSPALSEKLETPTENRQADDNTMISVSSGKVQKVPGRDLVGQEQPLSRPTRHVSPADTDMILGTRGMVSQMLNSGEFGDFGDGQGASRRISSDELMLKIARNRVLAELKKQFLGTSGHVNIANLIKPMSENPPVALRPAVPSKLEPAGDRDLMNALTIDADMDKEDTSFSRSQDSGENSDYSSRGTKRSSNTLSVNNAMMAITNMLLAEQKERLQRNRQRIRQHMLIQG